MALTITTPTLATSFTSTQVDTNFADVVNKFGSIDDSDVAANAGIAIGKMANQFQEVWVNLIFYATTVHTWTAAADPANLTIAEVRENAVLVPLPGSNDDPAWTAIDVSWACTDCGSAAGAFDVRFGALNAAGTTWVSAGIVVGAASMTITTDGNGNQGRALEGGSVSITQSATIRELALIVRTAGTGVMTTAGGDYLSVTVALRRQIQA